MALLRGFSTAHWSLFCALWLAQCKAPAASLLLFLFQDGSSYPALDWHMGVASVSSTYCRHLWDPGLSASWWHVTVGDRPLTATRQQRAGRPPNSQMGKWCHDSTFRETFKKGETERVSLSKSAQPSCPPAPPCTRWGLSHSHIIPWHFWQYPHWISQGLLQAPEAGTALCALSAGTAEHSGSCS